MVTVTAFEPFATVRLVGVKTGGFHVGVPLPRQKATMLGGIVGVGSENVQLAPAVTFTVALPLVEPFAPTPTEPFTQVALIW